MNLTVVFAVLSELCVLYDSKKNNFFNHNEIEEANDLSALKENKK